MKTAPITVAIAGVVLAVAAVVAAAPGKPFRVASSLDGKTVLPHRIHWLGLPTLPPAEISEVDFLIDGKVDWVEHHVPYVYGDNHGPHRNYLVTSWLRPGKHRFTVRAVASDGRTATDTVVARVLPAPEVPAALAGTWQRTISDFSARPANGTAGNPTDTLTPPGRYRLTFGRRWILAVFPCDSSPCRSYNAATGANGELASDWMPGATTFRVDGPVTIQVAHDSDRLGGWWCWMDGPSATYAWSVRGTTLTLAPVGGRDACGIRGFVWTGTWARVG